MYKLERFGLGMLMMLTAEVLLRSPEQDIMTGLMAFAVIIVATVIMLRAAFQK